MFMIRFFSNRALFDSPSFLSVLSFILYLVSHCIIDDSIFILNSMHFIFVFHPSVSSSLVHVVCSHSRLIVPCSCLLPACLVLLRPDVSLVSDCFRAPVSPGSGQHLVAALSGVLVSVLPPLPRSRLACVIMHQITVITEIEYFE